MLVPKYVLQFPWLNSGADPGFPLGGGANRPGGGGVQKKNMNLPKFPKNCMKLRNFRAAGGVLCMRPPQSANAIYIV